MSIIISKDGKNAERVGQSNFGPEDKLQEYIYNNPDSIPLYDIDEDTRLFIAAREFPTKSGPIDALGFDIKGNIYVVETKLFKNPDKRTVVAQALDYGASLWRHAVDFDAFISQLNLHTQKQSNKGFSEAYADFFRIDDSDIALEAIRTNLSDGAIKFVILMDKLHDPLKDLVIFVNQNSKFDLYAVELEYYKHAEFEIVIPKLFGAEVKKDVTTASASKSARPEYLQSSKEGFWESVDNYLSSGTLSPEHVRVMSLYSNQLKYLADATQGSISYLHKKSVTRVVDTILLNDSEGRVSAYMDSDSSIGFYMWGKAGRQIDSIQRLTNELIERKLMMRSDKHKSATQWFMMLSNYNLKPGELDQFIEIVIDTFKR